MRGAVWDGSYEYPEIAPPHRISITIDAESAPTKLFAQVYTKPGNIMVGGLRRLSAVNPRLDLEDVSPGQYNVRLIGYWQDDNVSYEFGLTFPGKAALISKCEMTLEGVEPRPRQESAQRRLLSRVGLPKSSELTLSVETVQTEPSDSSGDPREHVSEITSLQRGRGQG